MLGLIQNIRFDRNTQKSNYSFKKDLDNYNTSELLPSENRQVFGGKFLSSHWLMLYRRQ